MINEKDTDGQLPVSDANETEHSGSEAGVVPESEKKGCSPWLKLGCFVMFLVAIYALIFFSTAFVKITGIGQSHPMGDDWQEEVLLSDGTVIVIRRTIAGKPNIMAGYADFKAKSNSVEIVDGKGLEIPPRWEDKWKPLMLDRNTAGNWYLVVAPTYCYDWDSGFPYRQYEAIDGQWQRVEFDMSLEGRGSNLEWGLNIGSMPKLLKLENKPLQGNDAYRAGTKYIHITTNVTSDC